MHFIYRVIDPNGIEHSELNRERFKALLSELQTMFAPDEEFEISANVIRNQNFAAEIKSEDVFTSPDKGGLESPRVRHSSQSENQQTTSKGSRKKSHSPDESGANVRSEVPNQAGIDNKIPEDISEPFDSRTYVRSMHGKLALPTDLAAIVEAWPSLPDAVRTGICATVHALVKKPWK